MRQKGINVHRFEFHITLEEKIEIMQIYDSRELMRYFSPLSPKNLRISFHTANDHTQQHDGGKHLNIK